MSASFHVTLSRLRRLADRQTSDTRIELARSLAALEADVECWKSAGYETFEDVVRLNRLCDWRVYRAYLHAKETLGAEVFEQVGFWGAMRLVRAKGAERNKILSELLDWIATHNVFPTYQAIDVWLRKHYPHLLVNPGGRATRAHMLMEMYRSGYERLLVKLNRALDENRRLLAELRQLKEDR